MQISTACRLALCEYMSSSSLFSHALIPCDLLMLMYSADLSTTTEKRNLLHFSVCFFSLLATKWNFNCRNYSRNH